MSMTEEVREAMRLLFSDEDETPEGLTRAEALKIVEATTEEVLREF